MKKTLILVGILLALGGVWFLTQSDADDSSSILFYERDFRVKNVKSINKIFIAHKSGRTHTLIKGDPFWTIDNERVAPRAMKNVLATLGSMEIKYKPTDAAKGPILKHMIHSGIKIEIYDKNDKQMKVFYLGGTPPDELGTYAMMDGSENAYVVQRKLMNGSIRPVFQLTFDEWKDKGIFRLKSEQIKNVKVAYPYEKESSYELINKGSKKIEIKPLYENQKALPYKPIQGLADVYLSNFKEIQIEGFQNDFALRDSINSIIPYCTIEVQTVDEGMIALKLYPKAQGDRNVNMDPNFWKSGKVFRYYALDNKGDFIVLQQLNIGKALWKYPQFFRVKK